MTDLTTESTGNRWFVILGVLLFLTGAAALAFPMVATLSAEIFIGTIVLMAGIFILFHAFAQKEWSGFFWQTAIGILYIVGGLCFLAAPLGGVIALTVALGLMFAVEGIARMIMAFQIRPEQAWGWVLASGGVSLILGIVILVGLGNGASLAVIGLLVGINFIFAGSSFIAIGTGSVPLPKNAIRISNTMT